MKKLVSILLACVMVVGIVACGSTETAETKAAETAVSTTAAAKETKAAETAAVVEEAKPIHPVTTDPITISIITQRHTTATNNAEDIWFFKYMEWWLKENYGYNVTFDVQQTGEPEEQISLLLGTDTLPDIVWAINLSPEDAVTYGDGQGMLLDWRQYLNEEYMPNLYEVLYSDERADALAANTSLSGAIYSIPYLSGRAWNAATSSIGASQDRMFINTAWLSELGLEMPKNIDEFYDMLRAFRDNKKLESGEEVVPLLGNGDYLEKAFWTMHGYYGSELSKYGTQFAIKNGKITFPAYTDDYKSFIGVMKTLYDEKLISQDYFTMDTTTMRGLSKAGVAGAVSDSTMSNLEDFSEWDCMPWFTIGDTDNIYISTSTTYQVGNLWASAETKYPELIALIIDYIYSEEGCVMYSYGPMKDQDPLGLLPGWYLGSDSPNPTNELVENGTFSSYTAYCYEYVFPYSYAGRTDINLDVARKMGGSDEVAAVHEITDAVTGEVFTATTRKEYEHNNAQGHWFLSNSEVSRPHITTVMLPPAYMTEDDSIRAQELFSVIENHVISESAKFITGRRSMDELDTFMNELKTMGVEEYISLYENAYSSYMGMIYGK